MNPWVYSTANSAEQYHMVSMVHDPCWIAEMSWYSHVFNAMEELQFLVDENYQKCRNCPTLGGTQLGRVNLWCHCKGSSEGSVQAKKKVFLGWDCHPQTAFFHSFEGEFATIFVFEYQNVYYISAYFNLIRYIYIYMIWIHLYPKDFGTQIHGQLLVSV